MINQILLEKYAKLAVYIGANVQKGQYVFINASTDTVDLARAIAEQAYEAGAKDVVINWSDDYVAKSAYVHKDVEALKEFPEWKKLKYKDFIEQNGCAISISSPVPGLNNDIESAKLQAVNIASRKNLSFYYDHMMGSKSQWTIIAAPNLVWAKKVFPDLDDEQAYDRLWEEILKASRVTMENDPVDDWNRHNERLFNHNQILNQHDFKSLHFKNSLGTDITIGLVEGHIWAGGGEHTPEKLLFNPNIPTEENFTMPERTGVNGKVVATKPLNYQGKLIEDFWLEFKDGKVVDFDAKKERATLKNLIEFDPGSSYLGEVALISHNSPISQANILFFNTLFDENASCHLALGRAYPMNIKGGTEMKVEELEKLGYNNSMSHSDFMFGSSDMNIVGITKDGKEIQIFKDGNFVV